MKESGLVYPGKTDLEGLTHHLADYDDNGSFYRHSNLACRVENSIQHWQPATADDHLKTRRTAIISVESSPTNFRGPLFFFGSTRRWKKHGMQYAWNHTNEMRKNVGSEQATGTRSVRRTLSHHWRSLYRLIWHDRRPNAKIDWRRDWYYFQFNLDSISTSGFVFVNERLSNDVKGCIVLGQKVDRSRTAKSLVAGQ